MYSECTDAEHVINVDRACKYVDTDQIMLDRKCRVIDILMSENIRNNKTL